MNRNDGTVARNLGVVFDENLHLENHINILCGNMYYEIKIY